MWTDRFDVLDDASPADWLAARLGGSFGAAGRTIPHGFAAYARILHPSADASGRPVRWSRVAELTGSEVHATAQWDAIAGSDDGAYVEPPCGNLPIEPLVALCDLLAAHSSSTDAGFFCLWEGRGQLSAVPLHSALNAAELGSTRVSLPGRDYLLLRGPLSATAELARYDGDLPWTQSPNLFWPADRSWCVATEIDFDSTLVGGSAELVAAVLRSAELEAWPIDLDDSLASDGDRVNRR